MSTDLYQPIAIALGLGLIIGLQRQWKESDIAGIRTFPLMTILGTVTAMLDGAQGGWITAAGLLAIALMLWIANMTKIRASHFDPGMTTEVAAILMYCVGALLTWKLTGPAVVITGVVAVLLHWKKGLHEVVERFGEQDLKNIIHLVLIALVILPLMPNRTMGPYNVLNPYRIWWMVVLIVGISMAAYVAYKLLGTKVGTIVGGVLGGLISSTATTVSYSQLARTHQAVTPVAALVILIASTIVNVRVFIEVTVASPGLLQSLAMPLLLPTLGMLGMCVILYLSIGKKNIPTWPHEHPAPLRPAIFFGLLYALILLLVAAVRDRFGSTALYGVAAISGLTDVDAITLSAASLYNDGRIDDFVAWRLIVTAILSNLVFKAAAVAILGNRQLLRYIAVLFGIALVVGGFLLIAWP